LEDLQILDRAEMAWLDVTQCEDATTTQGASGNSAPSRQLRHRHRQASHPYDSYEAHNGSLFNGDDDEANRRFHFGGSSAAATYGDSVYDDHASFGIGEGGLDSRSSASRHLNSQSGYANDGYSDNDRRAAVTGASANYVHQSPNPNDEDSIPTVVVTGQQPGRRAGHTATAVNRKIYILGGSCGSDYLNDIFVLDTDPPPRSSVTEPNSIQLLDRRLQHFFNNSEFSDVTFLLEGGKYRVYGHKMVLSLASDCFRAMFTTGFREADAVEMAIPDCTYEAFLATIEYMYTGVSPATRPILNSPDRDRNLSRLIEILELSDRFMLDHLKQTCECMLEKEATNETVEALLSVAVKTNSIQLQAICEHFIRNRGDGRVARGGRSRTTGR
jgi:BTB/POZ domain/Kelch motif